MKVISESTRHEDELAIEQALILLQQTGRANLNDGSAKRLRYALDDAVLVLNESTSWRSQGF